jgi:hypothetical protein
MSTRGPMQVSTSGVVFYYDTFNDKSYLGEPTTNFYTNADLSGGNNVGQEGGSNPTNEVILFPNPGNSPYCVRSTAVGGSIYTEYQLTVTSTIQANTDYTLSCWVAWTPDWDGTYSVFHMRWYNSSGGQAGASGLEQGTTVATVSVNGLTWYKKYYTFNSGASVNGTHDWYAGYYSNNTKGYRYFTNFQLEAKNHPTQFSKGTRSSTQGLVDLVGNNTINLTSAEYDTSADITYSSTGVLNAGNIGSGYTNYTIECWFNSSDIVNYTTYSPNTGNVGPRLEQMSTGVIVAVWSGNTSNNSLYNYSNQFSISANRYNHFVMTCSGGTMNFYLNGQIVQSSVSSAQGYVTSFADTRIGVGFALDGTRYFRGKIPKFAVYNRALSFSEALRNYNSAKSRYGL